MNKLTMLGAAVAVALMASAASAQEVGLSVGSVEGRDTVASASYSPAVTGPFNTQVEFTYDTLVGDNSFDADLVGANLVKVVNLTDRLAVYGLGGVGYAWTNVEDRATYTYGAGVSYDLTDNLRLDARVREVEAFDSNTDAFTVSTVGFVARF